MANASINLGNGNWSVKESKLLGSRPIKDKIAPIEFDVTRASTATRVNKQGLIETVNSNIARIDYSNNANGALLLEPQSTNLISYSEDFSDSSWVKENVTVQSNTETSPDGFLNASYVIPSIGSGLTPRINYGFSSQSGVTYQSSIFVKKFNTDWIRVLSTGATGNTLEVYYDISNGVIGTGGNSELATIEDYGNGWYRLGLKIVSTNTSSGATFRVQFAGGDGNPTITTDGTEKFICWGAQLEENSYATSYIPTLTGTTQTRSAETCGGAGSSSSINSEEGVLYAEISALSDEVSSSQRSIQLEGVNGSGNNEIVIQYTSTGFRFLVYGNSSLQLNSSQSVSLNSYTKVALLYKNNVFKIYLNGLERYNLSGSYTMPTNLNKINFTRSGSSVFYGNTKDLRVYSTALSDSELQALTTL